MPRLRNIKKRTLKFISTINLKTTKTQKHQIDTINSFLNSLIPLTTSNSEYIQPKNPLSCLP